MAIEVVAEVRTEKNPRELRRQGFIPGVVYGAQGHHQIQIPQKSLRQALSRATRSSHFTVKVGQDTFDTFLREVQYNPLSDAVLHVDFFQPQPDQPVTMRVPIVLHGTPIGLKAGGFLSQILEILPVRGAMENIPEKIEVEITNMDVGDVLRVGDLDLSGVSVLVPLDSTIATVKLPRRLEVAEVEAVEEEAVAEEAAEEAAQEAADETESSEAE